MDARIPPEIVRETGDPAAALRELEASVRACRLCGLCDGRTQVVFGVGSATAVLMFVGEGPGFHEDRLGEPFVGQAGKLLTTLLGQIGLTRAEVYIANVVKCRPPQNRDPTAEELEACSRHLMQQMAIIRPKVICTLGRFAARLLSGSELSISAIHGKAKPVTLGGVDTIVFPIFHPAAALYTPANRAVLEEDFLKLRRLLDRGPETLRSDDNGGIANHEVAPNAQASAGRGSSSGSTNSGDRARPLKTEEQLPLW
ncbi:MAG: uracil-DNA glycosylase [Actinobacteria bacterium]|nr:uracil-DNA glycosylase [Actinomycetota bacterium]